MLSLKHIFTFIYFFIATFMLNWKRWQLMRYRHSRPPYVMPVPT